MVRSGVVRSGMAGCGVARSGVVRSGVVRRWWARLRTTGADDRGMTTAEYAVGTLAACALAAVLYKVVTSGPVQALLRSVIERAINVQF